MSHPVIHKTDIGKVKTSKNVMKLLKLLLTVIVKHPVGILFKKGLFCQQFLWDVKRHQGHVYKNGCVTPVKRIVTVS